LGSTQHNITRIFVSHGLTLAAIGVVCGLVAAALGTRLMSSLLFEISPLDPVTFAAVPLALALAAALASYIPALRTASLDPVKALRMD
jgi:ABC-type lipoprotein release transport system permease subunit